MLKLDVPELINMVTSNNYVVYDTETSLIDKEVSIYTKPPKFVMAITHDCLSGDKRAFYSQEDLSFSFADRASKYPYILVGHNLPFDLVQANIICSATQKIFFWDTAIFEYEYSGQHHTFPSLNSLAHKYKLESKDDVVSEMIKSGIDPLDIDPALLARYCEQDVNITRKVFDKQIENLNGLYSGGYSKKANLLLERMKFRAYTHDMSMCGMYLNTSTLTDGLDKLVSRATSLREYLTIELGRTLRDMPFEDLNIDSNKQIATYLFGGDYTYTKTVGTGVLYKTGARAGTEKTKVEKFTGHVYESVMGKFLTKNTDTSEATLKQILNIKGLSVEYFNFISYLLEYRKATKLQSTYFSPYKTNCKISPKGEYLIAQCEFKHTITPTGRISCNKPNIQNIKGD
jgi:DNA polymerase I-like protein with 3'-5' exonuclease and polymerase domains